MIVSKRLNWLTKTCWLESWNVADPESHCLRLSLLPPVDSIVHNIQAKAFGHILSRPLASVSLPLFYLLRIQAFWIYSNHGAQAIGSRWFEEYPQCEAWLWISTSDMCDWGRDFLLHSDLSSCCFCPCIYHTHWFATFLCSVTMKGSCNPYPVGTYHVRHEHMCLYFQVLLIHTWLKNKLCLTPF